MWFPMCSLHLLLEETTAGGQSPQPSACLPVSTFCPPALGHAKILSCSQPLTHGPHYGPHSLASVGKAIAPCHGGTIRLSTMSSAIVFYFLLYKRKTVCGGELIEIWGRASRHTQAIRGPPSTVKLHSPSDGGPQGARLYGTVPGRGCCGTAG